MSDQLTDDYGIAKIKDLPPVEAPDLPYQPQDPKRYRPKIGLIGCGGVSIHHLKVYQLSGYDVIAFCDVNEERAKERQRQFYPDAQVFTDYRELLKRHEIEVVDIATHPNERAPMIEEALRARKHVLSQKPFVLDLDLGERLVGLADAQDVKLAINQNGRWAPHFSYMRQALSHGLIGDILTANFSVHWDHSWICGTEFENVKHLILYDFGIHWFDMINCFMQGREATRVYASIQRTAAQRARPAMLGQAVFDFAGAQATLAFNGDTRFGPQDRTFLAGTDGSMVSTGPDLMQQTVTLYNTDGYSSPNLQGQWFPTGFHGAMAELLCAIEENREPANSGRDNLRTLAFCFAAIASAEDGLPKRPGECRSMPDSAYSC